MCGLRSPFSNCEVVRLLGILFISKDLRTLHTNLEISENSSHLFIIIDHQNLPRVAACLDQSNPLSLFATRFSLRHDILSQRECVGSQITSARQALKVQCKLRQRLKATQHLRDADGRTSPVRLRSHWHKTEN